MKNTFFLHTEKKKTRSFFRGSDTLPKLPLADRLLHSDLRNDARVVDYALRSLRSCSVRAVIFLIPQLVQVLRYDRTGLLEQFLRATSKASELVAHQVIWNTHIYTTKDATKDDAGTAVRATTIWRPSPSASARPSRRSSTPSRPRRIDCCSSFSRTSPTPASC